MKFVDRDGEQKQEEARCRVASRRGQQVSPLRPLGLSLMPYRRQEGQYIEAILTPSFLRTIRPWLLVRTYRSASQSGGALVLRHSDGQMSQLHHSSSPLRKAFQVAGTIKGPSSLRLGNTTMRGEHSCAWCETRPRCWEYETSDATWTGPSDHWRLKSDQFSLINMAFPLRSSSPKNQEWSIVGQRGKLRGIPWGREVDNRMASRYP